MKRTRWTTDSPHLALSAALASAALLSAAAIPALAVGDIATASASSGVSVSILSPTPGSTLVSAGKIEISAFYESSYGVSSVDLFIDGHRMATQRLTSPEGRGEITFLVDPAVLAGGSHTIVVRATATDQEAASARTVLTLPSEPQEGQAQPAAPSIGGALSDAVGPTIKVMYPAPNSTVQGIVRIKVDATDPSGKSPYVSLFVDHAFKTLRNFGPYAFDWDTTRLPNGYHTIEVLGYNDAQQVGQAAPIRVYVNNPGGRTFERHDLSDAPALSDHAPSVMRRKAVPSAAHADAVRVKTRRVAAGPQIARPGRRSIANVIARADKLASVGTGGSVLSDIAIPDAPVAPSTHGSSATLKVKVHAVVRPGYKITSSHGAPAFANPAYRPAKPMAASQHMLGVSNAGAIDLSNLQIPTGATAPKLPAPAAAMRGENRMERVEMAAAGLSDSDVAVGGHRITAPKIDISRIEARSRQELPTIEAGKVQINRISSRDISNLRGEYQVVVDNRRVEMDRPLTERGDILFAPMRQIIESQGGLRP